MVAVPLDELRRNTKQSVAIPAGEPGRATKACSAGARRPTIRPTAAKAGNQRGGAPAEAGFAPARVTLPRSPIVAKPGADLGKNHAPPKTYEAPKPDPKVAAKPRVNRSPEQPQQRTVNRVPLDQPRTQPQPPPKVERAPQPQRQPQGRTGRRPQPRAQARRLRLGQIEARTQHKGKDKN